MSEYGDLTTVYKCRSLMLESGNTGADVLLADYIQQVTAEIEDAAHRRFLPRIETRRFDAPRLLGDPLLLDDDLLALTSLTNGDGEVMASDDYTLYPLNGTPKTRVELYSALMSWQYDASKGNKGVIEAAGVWGYHSRYTSAWKAVTTLSAGISDSAISATVPTGVIHAGELLKIESEYVYVVSVSVGTTDTLTIERGVNGSTSAAHLAVAVSRWQVTPEIANLAARATVAYYKLRTNPTNDTVTVDGVTFVTPKDVNAYILKSLRNMGLIREALA